MAVFSGAYEETFTIDVPVEKAKAHFSDLDTIGKNYEGIDKYDKLDDRSLHIQLVPQSAMGATYQGKHVCRYVFGDKDLTWTSDPGDNMRSRGYAQFRAISDNRTSVSYRDELECDIEINRFIAKALTPIVRRNIEKGVKAYLERMRKAL